MNISKENKQFGIAEVLLFGENSIVFSFLVLFLKNQGFSGTQTGFILSLTMAACLIAQPIAGFIGDNFLEIKKIVVINLLVSILSIGAIYFVPGNYAFVFGCFLLYSLFGRYLPGLMDVYITKMSHKRSGLYYGFVRGLGSFGYAVTALIIGFLIARLGFWILFVSHTLFALLTIFFVLRLPSLPEQKKTKSDIKKESFFTTIKKLLKNKKYLIIIFSIFIIHCGFNGFGAYLPLYLETLGGNSSTFGLCVFLMAMSEIPVLWNFHRINRRFSAEKLLMTSVAVGFLKIILTVMTSNIPLVLIIQMCQTLSVGLFAPSVILCIRALLPEEQLSVGILLSVSIYSGGSVIISNLFGGIVLENSGIGNMFKLCALVSFVGVILLFISMGLFSGKKIAGLIRR